MLTKTKKWLLAFVLAFVAMFLVACDDSEEEPVAPEELTISVDVFVDDNAVLVGGEMYLSVQVTPADASDEVVWSSSRPDIAIVNQEGKVLGINGGLTTITATSKYDETVKDEVEVKVLVDLDQTKVLVEAMEDVKAKVPEFIAEDTEMPSPSNELVTAEYYLDGVKLNGNIYRVDYKKDTYVNLDCKLIYGEEEVTFPVTFRLVSNVDHNDFTAIAEAQEALNEYLQFFKDYKIYGDIKLPTTLSQLYEWEGLDKEVRQEVYMTWSSLSTNLLSSDGEYFRPNDDESLRLEVVFLSGNNTGISRHDFTVKGYTADEKMEWLLENVLVVPEEIEGQNIILPTTDSQFKTAITWESSNAQALGANGKMDPYLQEETTVTLKAIVSYDSLNDDFDFTREVEFEVLVKPCTNDAQKVALDLSNKFDAPEFPHYFPWGLTEDNKIPLPMEVEEGDFAGTAITWTVSEEGLFDEEWVIQKQFLRYHEVVLTYSVTVGEDTATGQVPINVGVAKVPNTMYIGGNMYSRSPDQAQPWDELHQMKTSDGPSGSIGSNLDVFGWSGYTTYVDIDGVRYQWFHAGWYTAVADSLEGLVLTEDDAIQGGLLSVSGNGGTNRQILFVNNTEKALKFPVGYYTGALPDNVEFELGLDKCADGTDLDRNGMAVDAFKYGMVVNPEGVVTWASGLTAIQQVLVDQKSAEVGEGETIVLPDYFEVPAGGFLLATKYAGPKAGLQDIIFKEGLEFTIESFGVAPQVE